MAINKGKLFAEGDVFIDYPYEQVMFRWDHATQKIYRRFYGEDESIDPVPHENRLFNEAILYGDQITKMQYDTGKSS